MKKNKKIFIIGSIMLIVIFGAIILLKNKGEDGLAEYIPEQEISEEQQRQTFVSLYFKNKDAGHLMPEARFVDAKLLLENPYYVLVEMLIQGPNNDKLEGIIPKNTKINEVKIEKGIVNLDLSIDFINNVSLGKEEETKIVQSITYTLFELTEVDSVKIIIDGEEGKAFADNEVDFRNVFMKNNDL